MNNFRILSIFMVKLLALLLHIIPIFFFSLNTDFSISCDATNNLLTNASNAIEGMDAEKRSWN